MSLKNPTAILVSAVVIVGAILINGSAETSTQEMGYGVAAGTHASNQGVAFVVNRDGKTFSVDVPQVNVTDTTGAGDAFRAGIVYGQLEGWALEDSIKLAVASGALQVVRDASVTPPASLQEAQSIADTLSIST